MFVFGCRQREIEDSENVDAVYQSRQPVGGWM